MPAISRAGSTPQHPRAGRWWRLTSFQVVTPYCVGLVSDQWQVASCFSPDSAPQVPPTQKASHMYLHQKPPKLHPVPSAPMADERHQEHGSQEALQGPYEEVHGKKEMAGNEDISVPRDMDPDIGLLQAPCS